MGREAELYSVHVGMSKMKSLAKGYVWWPQLDTEIKEMVQDCGACAAHQTVLPKAESHLWTDPQPSERVPIDQAGRFRNQSFLIIFYAFSNRLETFPIRNINTSNSIDCL